jgi:hypothetical protein
VLAAVVTFPFTSSASSLYHNCVKVDGGFERTEAAPLLVHSTVHAFPLWVSTPPSNGLAAVPFFGWSGEWRPTG